MDRVAAYAEAHPDSFGGLCWNNEPDVRIEVWFIGDAEPHRRALAGRLAYPDRLDVRSARYTESELHALRDRVIAEVCELRGEAQWPFSAGTNVQTVSLGLPPEAAAIGDELLRRHGDLIELRLEPQERRRLLRS